MLRPILPEVLLNKFVIGVCMAREIVGCVSRFSVDGRTVYVETKVRMPHKRYGKVIIRSRTYCAEGHGATYSAGDIVKIVPSAPISKTKRWVVKV